MSKFYLGQVVCTCSVAKRTTTDDDFREFVMNSLKRYSDCDWGDTCDEDQKLNETALEDGERIMAVYIHPKTEEKIWIITEADRSVTTILFPEEY